MTSTIPQLRTVETAEQIRTRLLAMISQDEFLAGFDITQIEFVIDKVNKFNNGQIGLKKQFYFCGSNWDLEYILNLATIYLFNLKNNNIDNQLHR